MKFNLLLIFKNSYQPSLTVINIIRTFSSQKYQINDFLHVAHALDFHHSVFLCSSRKMPFFFLSFLNKVSANITELSREDYNNEMIIILSIDTFVLCHVVWQNLQHVFSCFKYYTTLSTSLVVQEHLMLVWGLIFQCLGFEPRLYVYIK